VYHYIYELVINLLVSNNRCYQLHQLMQYHVVRDSEHVACLLLSLVPKYPPAYQLAIDMLKRLGTYEDIVEVLLVKQQVRRRARAGVALMYATAASCVRPMSHVTRNRLLRRSDSCAATTTMRVCGRRSSWKRRRRRTTERYAPGATVATVAGRGAGAD